MFNMALDENHDIVIGRGIKRIGGVEYVAQLVKTRLLFYFGEWDLDRTLGIDWYNLLGSNYDLSLIQGTITQTIKDTRGVLSLDSIVLTVDRVERKLTITFTATSIYGELSSKVII